MIVGVVQFIGSISGGSMRIVVVLKQRDINSNLFISHGKEST